MVEKSITDDIVYWSRPGWKTGARGQAGQYLREVYVIDRKEVK